MTEFTGVSDQAAIEELVAGEDSMSLQAYEYFDGDSDERLRTRELFLREDTGNPNPAYPKLQLDEFTARIASLKTLKGAIDAAEGLSPEAHAAYEGTVSYRIAELDLLAAATELNVPGFDDEELAKRASTYQDINEAVYGVPDPKIFSGVVSELRAMTAETDYKGQARDLHEEVIETVFAPYADPSGERLPVLTDEARAFLKEMIDKTYQPEQLAVDRRWELIQSEGRDAFEPHDMVAVFEDVIAARGLEGVVSAFIKPGSAMMSWSQAAFGVSIGELRAAISLKPEMFGKVIHELGLHGVRGIVGRSSGVAVTGNGLVTRRPDGTYNSYITFEEGEAAINEEVGSQSLLPWSIESMRGVLHTGLAYEGNDFRGIFEKSWRIRSLLAASRADGMLAPEALTKARVQAYDDVFRVLRGTPMQRTPVLERPITFNKDLGPYAPGKVLATEFWNRNAGKESLFYFLLTGKFDATDPVQVEIAHIATYGIFRDSVAIR